MRDDVFHAENEYGRSIRYQGLEIVQEELPEFVFRNNKLIIWSLYYFLPNIIKAYLSQEQEDFKNRILYYGQEEAGKAIIDERNKRTDQIIELSKGFCDRNFIFAYLKGKLSVNPDYFLGVILSELLESLSLEQYAQYTEFDYSTYTKKHNWNFGKKSLNEYIDLASLPEFERLTQLLSNVAFVLQLNNPENSFKESKTEDETATTIIINAQIEDVTEQNIVLLPDTQIKVEEPEPILKYEQEDDDPEEQIQPTEKVQKSEYLLPVPILNQIYEEFTNGLWYDITLFEFLNMFTSVVVKQVDFKLKHKQTARFYYLLKKIWLNCDQSLFYSEKEWIMPFLKNYDLSYSAYTNQFIANEGGVKHLKFTRSVNKILLKKKEF